MKIKVLAITVLLCCLHTIYVFGTPEEDYKVLNQRKYSTEIEVYRDCKIIIADIAPDSIKQIYGDKVNGNSYGRNVTLFNSNQVTPNEEKKGIKICQENERVVLKIEYAELKQKTEIQIVSANKDTIAALPDSSDFFPGQKFKIVIKKSKTDRLGEQNLTDTVGKIILPLFVTFLVGLFFGYLLFKQNRKALKKLSKELSELKKVVDSLEIKDKIQVDAPQITQQKDKGRNSMTDEDIKRFIVEQIKNSQTQFSPSTFQTAVAANSNEDPTVNPVKKEELVTDTDNVKFHLEDNSFTLEQTDQKIFRIYSKEGEFYYTIVNDSAVREEFSCMIQTFGGFLNYLSTGGEATSIEVVNDGKLRKDGNRFYVDANNKLVVKFV